MKAVRKTGTNERKIQRQLKREGSPREQEWLDDIKLELTTIAHRPDSGRHKKQSGGQLSWGLEL